MYNKDDNRLASFRQFRKEIRGSQDHLIVGIDVAKDRHHAFFGTATGKTLFSRLLFDNNLAGFEKLLDRTGAIQAKHNVSNAVFGLEPTASYHKPLGEFLIRRSQMVVLVSVSSVKHNRSLLDGRWDKHDRKDAANIADLISQGKCQFYENPHEEIRNLRALLLLKRKLKKYEHGYGVRIRNQLIAQYFPELDRFSVYPETEAIVRWCLDPARIVSLEADQFITMVAPGRRTAAKQQRLEAIRKLALESIGCSMGEGAGFDAQVMVEGLRQIRAMISETAAQIEAVCRRFPEYGCLLTIPGFGPDVSSKVLGALGNPYRFRNHKQVLKTAGLDLNASRSGNTSNSAVPVISKKGKADLRYALYQAARIASTRNKDVMAYFNRQLEGREKERGIKTKLWVKVAAKFLIIAWTLMKNKEVFDSRYLNRA